jgi:hypothetical protein
VAGPWLLSSCRRSQGRPHDLEVIDITTLEQRKAHDTRDLDALIERSKEVNDPDANTIPEIHPGTRKEEHKWE